MLSCTYNLVMFRFALFFMVIHAVSCPSNNEGRIMTFTLWLTCQMTPALHIWAQQVGDKSIIWSFTVQTEFTWKGQIWNIIVIVWSPESLKMQGFCWYTVALHSLHICNIGIGYRYHIFSEQWKFGLFGVSFGNFARFILPQAQGLGGEIVCAWMAAL